MISLGRKTPRNGQDVAFLERARFAVLHSATRSDDERMLRSCPDSPAISALNLHEGLGGTEAPNMGYLSEPGATRFDVKGASPQRVGPHIAHIRSMFIGYMRPSSKLRPQVVSSNPLTVHPNSRLRRQALPVINMCRSPDVADAVLQMQQRLCFLDIFFLTSHRSGSLI